MAFTVQLHSKQTGVYTVRPEGYLDSNTYSILEERIAPILVPSTKVIIFDMTNLEYISSAGLRVLFKAAKALRENDGTYIMTNLKPQIKKVFEIVKALPSMRIFKSEKEIDDYLDAMQKRAAEEGTGSSDA
jgi:anti-anti-sigma factor